ncbi:HNH endonuclease [Boudabousia tangfeifanii]|uniref:Putative HNH nuclease YajD n=1 Tax=Boudabousia tangfeifanii TaxID=1912795 RepID=A0A1D9MLC4_9ACTO|nr:HNH endonuclease signature motif containing protein [Boudabousia tangfeifanii]AOZ73102.1 HNH endonuclease [Boudabousia tangfeifanii]
MPRRPKTPCRWPGCPALTDARYCETHTKEADTNYRRYERDPEINKRYGSTWRKIRAQYVAKYPLCEQCEAEGRLTPVAEVHHIRPLSHGGTHDENNLMSLCKPCHSRQTALDGDRWRRRNGLS